MRTGRIGGGGGGGGGTYRPPLLHSAGATDFQPHNNTHHYDSRTLLTRQQVGLTAKEVGRLAKRRPDVIENIGGGHVPRLVDFFLEDLRIGKVIDHSRRVELLRTNCIGVSCYVPTGCCGICT